MPARSPFYEFPPFSPTGDTGVDNSLERWRQEAGNIYTRNLFEAERYPLVQSTFRNDNVTLTTVVQTYLSTSIGLQGGEAFLVLFNADVVSRGDAIRARIEVTFPNGDTQTLTSAESLFWHNSTAHFLRGVAGNMTIVNPRIQFGGLHKVELRLDKFSNASTGSVNAANVVLLGL